MYGTGLNGIYTDWVSRKGYFKKWYYNGNQKYEMNYMNGYIYGEFKEWHENGEKAKEGFVKEGLLGEMIFDGEYKEFHDNGKLAKKGFFKDKKKNGIFVEFYRDGKPLSMKTYKDDELNGR